MARPVAASWQFWVGVLSVFVLLLVLLAGCSPVGADADKSSDGLTPANKNDLIAARDREIAALKAEVAQLQADKGSATPRPVAPARITREATDEPEPLAPAPRAEQYPGLCYKDYCPCEQPQEGMDMILCDQLEEGLDVPIELMIAGRGSRESRRQMRELGY